MTLATNRPKLASVPDADCIITCLSYKGDGQDYSQVYLGRHGGTEKSIFDQLEYTLQIKRRRMDWTAMIRRHEQRSPGKTGLALAERSRCFVELHFNG